MQPKEDAILVPHFGPISDADVVVPSGNALDGKQFIEAWIDSTEQRGGSITVTKGILGSGEIYVTRVAEASNRYRVALNHLAQQYKKTKNYDASLAKQILTEKQRLIDELRHTLPPAQGFVQIPKRSLDAHLEQLREIETKKSSKARRLARKKLVRRVSHAAGIESGQFVSVGSRSLKYLKRANKVMVAVEFAPLAAAVISADNEEARKKAFTKLAIKTTSEVSGAAVTAGALKLCVVFGVATGGFGFVACGALAIGTGIYFGQYVDDQLKSLQTKEEPAPVIP